MEVQQAMKQLEKVFKDLDFIPKKETKEEREYRKNEIMSRILFRHPSLKHIRALFVRVVTAEGHYVYHAGKEIRNDKTVMLLAIENHENNYEFASIELKGDRDVLLKLIQKNLLFALKKTRERPEWKNTRFILDAAKDNIEVLQNSIIQPFAKDRVFFDEAVHINGKCIKFACDEFQNDRKLVLSAVKQNGFSIQYAAEVLKSDREIGFHAVMSHGVSLCHLSDELRNDEKIVMVAIFKSRRDDRDVFNYIGDDLLKKSVVLKIIHTLKGDIEHFFDHYRDEEVCYSFDDVKHVSLDDLHLTSHEKFEIPVDDRIWMRIIFEKLESVHIERMVPVDFSERTDFSKNSSLYEAYNMGRLYSVVPNEFIFHRQIGKGTYGTAYLCSLIDRVGLFCFKTFHLKEKLMSVLEEKNKKKKEKKKQKSPLRKKNIIERERLDVPPHDNVVPILNFGSAMKFHEFVTKYFPRSDDPARNRIEPRIQKYYSPFLVMKHHKMDLESYMNEKNIVSLRGICRILKGILKGVRHLRKNYIIHRDLHAGNIFVDPSNGRVWIGDFGCCLDLRKNDGFDVEKYFYLNNNQKERIFQQEKYEMKKFVLKPDDDIQFSISSGGWDKSFPGWSQLVPPECKNQGEEYVGYFKRDLFSIGKLGRYVLERQSCGCHPSDPKNDKPIIELLTSVFDQLLCPDPKERIEFFEALDLLEIIVAKIEQKDERENQQQTQEEEEEEIEGEEDTDESESDESFGMTYCWRPPNIYLIHDEIKRTVTAGYFPWIPIRAYQHCWSKDVLFENSKLVYLEGGHLIYKTNHGNHIVEYMTGDVGSAGSWKYFTFEKLDQEIIHSNDNELEYHTRELRKIYPDVFNRNFKNFEFKSTEDDEKIRIEKISSDEGRDETTIDEDKSNKKASKDEFSIKKLLLCFRTPHIFLVVNREKKYVQSLWFVDGVLKRNWRKRILYTDDDVILCEGHLIHKSGNFVQEYVMDRVKEARKTFQYTKMDGDNYKSFGLKQENLIKMIAEQFPFLEEEFCL